MKKGRYEVAGFCVFVILFSLYGTFALGVVRNVPSGAYPTIQSAIDVSGNGDEIVVSPGTYVENINLSGKNIILRSTDAYSSSVVASTIINGNTFGSVVTFVGTEGASCVLSGFTITNGFSGMFAGGINGSGTVANIHNNMICGNQGYYGGGLFACDGAIYDNTISNNSAFDSGGGLYDCDGTVCNNTISENSAYLRGGGLRNCDGTIKDNSICGNWTTGTDSLGGGLATCDGVIEDNTISGNSSDDGGGLDKCNGTIQNNIISGNSADDGNGGGLYDCNGIIQSNMICNNTAEFSGAGISACNNTIQNNMVFNNSADSGGGLGKCNGTIQNNTIWGNWADYSGCGLYWCQGTIRNCIIWGNAPLTNAQLYNCATPSYCCIQNWTGGGIGTITDNPQLVDPGNGNFHLKFNSPCIDAGCLITGLIQDFEGNPRPLDGASEFRGDGSDYDIGADEYYPSLACVQSSLWTLLW